tara:strand:+ start:510 stop:764 length:255 start_codon:yes stop_codon:yes gene_type:complete
LILKDFFPVYCRFICPDNERMRDKGENPMNMPIENGFAVFLDDTVVSIGDDFGHAAELEMVLSEMHPDSKFTIREFRKFGAIIL